jgi:tetratricopeptide (TPR) repeat protein
MARVNYGALLRLVGRVPEATAMLEQVIAENPRVQFAHHNLGLARLDAGDSARAIAEFRRELERQPTFIPAMLELIWLYAAGPEPALRDAAEAGRLARRARELSAGGDAALLDAHAAALAAGGDFARAIETAERAAELATETRRARIRERIEGYRRGEPFVGRP